MARFAPPGTFETVQKRRERNAQAFDDRIAQDKEERQLKIEADVRAFDDIIAQMQSPGLSQQAIREEEAQRFDATIQAQQEARQGVQTQRQTDAQAEVAKFDAAVAPTGPQAGLGEAIAPNTRQGASQWMRENIDQLNAAVLAPGQFESEQFKALPPMVQQILTERRQGGVSPGQAALNLGGTALKLLDEPRQLVGVPAARKLISGDVPVPALNLLGAPGATGGDILRSRGVNVIPEETAEEILSFGLDPLNLAPGIGFAPEIARGGRAVARSGGAALRKVPGLVDTEAARVAGQAATEPFGARVPEAVTGVREVSGRLPKFTTNFSAGITDNLEVVPKQLFPSTRLGASGDYVVGNMNVRLSVSSPGIKNIWVDIDRISDTPSTLAEMRQVGDFIQHLRDVNPTHRILANPASERLKGIYTRFGFSEIEPDLLELPAGKASGLFPSSGAGREVAEEVVEAGAKQAVKPSVRIPEAAPGDPLWKVAARNIEETLPTAKREVTLAETARTPVRAQRSSSYVDEYNRLVRSGVDPVEADKRASKFLAGKLPAPAPLKVELPEEQRLALFRRASEVNAEGQIGNFELKRVVKALAKLDEGVEPLQLNEINLIRKVYGDGMADVLQKAGGTKLGIGDYLYDIAVLPKAVLSAFDVSYPFRQGIMLGPAHPKEFFGNMPEMFRVWGSEARAQRLQASMLDDAFKVPVKEANGNTTLVNFGELFDEHGLYRSLDPALESAEEVFRGRLAENLGKWFGPPGTLLSKGIRASNRSFTTYGNKLRNDVAKDIVTKWIKADVEITPDRIRTLSNMLNRFSGRGTLGNAALTKAMQVLFWSPQLRVSGPQAWASVLQLGKQGDPLVRGEAAKNLVAFVTTGVGLLSLAALSGQFEVNIDPRSTDFGRMKIGNQRFNFWGSQQTLVRTVARILTERRYDETLGLVPTGRADQAIRWMRSGLAPEWAAVWDVLKGETFIGEPLRLDAETAKREAFNRLVPLATQDIIDAVREEGAIAAGVTAPIALLGGGVQTYDPGIRRQLLETPKYVGLTPREIFDIKTLNERVRDQRNEWEMELGVKVPMKDAIEVVGRQMGLPQHVITMAQILQSVKQRTNFPEQGGLLNPEWVGIVVENQDDLENAGLEDLLGTDYITDAVRASKGLPPVEK